jgi:Protein of unknown function (DUF3179)
MSHRRVLLRAVVLGVVAAGLVSATVGIAGHGSGTRDHPSTDPTAQSLPLDFRPDQVACSPTRRYEALMFGAGPFCVPFDSIPAIDHPRFQAANRVRFLGPAAPVIAIEVRGVARAYPVAILAYHEIVNDVVGGEPVAVTFCPLCNSPVAYDRRLDGHTVRFGVTGELAESNLIMFDRRTRTWWQQLSGRAIAGPLTGRTLRPIAATMVAFGPWRAAHPDASVMRPPARSPFRYAVDPYGSYDRGPRQPGALVRTEPYDHRLPPKRRVIGVPAQGGRPPVAFALPAGRGTFRLARGPEGSPPLVALFGYGERLPETGRVPAEARVGWSGSVFVASADGHPVDLVATARGFVDRATRSRFDLLGRAVSGPLADAQLPLVPQAQAFWFAWSHFSPNTLVSRPGR